MTRQQRDRRNRKRKRRRRERRRILRRILPVVQFDDDETTAILDTNVLLDIVSCHDVLDSLNENDKQRRIRMRRAAEALRLSIYFHETGALTLSHASETLRKLLTFAPPGKGDMRTAFVQLWLHFIKDELLPGWRTGDVPGDVPRNIEGDGVDDALVSLAVKYKCPLISHEGYGKGPGKRLRRYLIQQAVQAGVQVVDAATFYRGKLKAPSIERFMVAFHQRMRLYHRGERDYADAQRGLGYIYDFYAFVLNSTALPEEFI